MVRQGWMELEELMHQGKIRKRGCSSLASSSSSALNNYRFKRAIVVGKRAGPATPVPTWKLISLGGGGTSPRRSVTSFAVRTPEHSPSSVSVKGKSTNYNQQQLISARKLAATLWEANEVFSPLEKKEMKTKECRPRGKASLSKSVRAGSLLPPLSDPSHSPVSERMDRSASGSHHKKSSSHSRKFRQGENGVGSLDSFNNACIMEIENRTRAQTPSKANDSVKSRLKEVSNALTTAKELLKIMHRVRSSEDSTSSVMSLLPAVHAEVKRARLQVNQALQDPRSDQTEINYLLKCFEEERTAWKNKEQKVVSAAIESMAGELEIEKTLRRRLESVNKQLGKELATTKSSLLKVEKELENEKTARIVIEQVCNELVDRAKENAAEESKIESAKNGEAERNIYQIADEVHETRTHLKKTKVHRGEKNTPIDKVVSRLEAFLGTKRSKDKVPCHFDGMNDEAGSHVGIASCTSRQNGILEDDGGEVDNGAGLGEVANDSDDHPIELNMDNSTKSYKWKHSFKPPRDSRKTTIAEEFKSRQSTSKGSGSTFLHRSTSDVINLGAQSDKLRFLDDKHDRVRHSAELERPAARKNYGDDIHRNQSIMDIRGHSPASRTELVKYNSSQTNLPLHSRVWMPQGSKSKLAVNQSEALGSRKSIR